ncbi:hypothetical protein SAMN02745784_01230 [Tissierella praeacuta DSM 18095]|uniref:Uncharacterized protein n=1 Tax=Tissierella praeacuta DSM 18095 TaxID=1123404 RepID=A0A1M4UW57_9FIRM|nr:DUF6550 family protein [Tissierella praeacuta]SHE60976.1 hypothetical protein SAMN02745784_01230 [Tissierella praeacuta DSM 18095]SUP02646.1 Uncharacterised protein [Tissierella praeacuta]
MKNISEKTKKWLLVTGGLVICVMLILMISSQFRKEPIEDTLPNQNIEVDDVTIEKPKDTEKAEKEEVTNDEDKTNNEKEDEIIVSPIKTPDTQSTNKNGVDKGTEQTIQKNAEKPKEPTKEQLTDPTQKPNGEKVTEPPVNVDHEKVEKPEELPKQKDEPKGGDVNNKGQTYLPGFGWIENSGENQGTEVDGDGDINKQIGDMN